MATTKGIIKRKFQFYNSPIKTKDENDKTITFERVSILQ